MPREYIQNVAPIERFMGRFDIQDNGCWMWTGSLYATGYGRLWNGAKDQYAHVFSYLHFKGEIPNGQVLDHKCHDPELCAGGPECLHRRCVNPEHIEPSTRRDNVTEGRTARCIQRKTHCEAGHELTPENTRISRVSRNRSCIMCSNLKNNKWRKENGLTPLLAEVCRRGHSFSPENIYIVPSKGTRRCLTCIRANLKEYRRRG